MNNAPWCHVWTRKLSVTSKVIAVLSSPGPLILNCRLLIWISRQSIVEAAIAFFDSTPRVQVVILILLFHAIRVAVVSGDVINGASRLITAAVSLVSDHAGDSVGGNAVKPGLALGGYSDDRELKTVSTCLAD